MLEKCFPLKKGLTFYGLIFALSMRGDVDSNEFNF